ncbi:hypothetical protein [uncultured Maribacter sp.]|uniref:hypothetical protein n=1 Tax=uncultured Maribacter sp. TaxID=431308 RepID=UPI002606075D|nr:hypothetical protein [uncultured Maribacter sp.]
MKNTIRISIALLLLFTATVSGQDFFEGELHYKIEYESLNKNITTSILETQFGTSFSAYVKEDRYAMIYHAEGELGYMKIIVRLDEGYSYTEFEKRDTITKTKFGTKNNKLLDFKRNTGNKKEVLGELCESVTLNYETEDSESFFKIHKGTYYFNPKYKLNASLYKNYSDGFWNLFVKESNAISIRNETEFMNLFKSVSTAVSIEEKELPLDFFIPNPLKIISE